MLIVSRRPGESIVIGDNIELMIVDVDWFDIETRCAITVRDGDGNDLPLQHQRMLSGVTIVREKKG